MRNVLAAMLVFLLIGSVCFAADTPAAPNQTIAEVKSAVTVYPATTSTGSRLTVDLTRFSNAQDENTVIQKSKKADFQQVATDGGYVVVTSKNTYNDPQWHEVVKVLSFKHNAEIMVYEGTVAIAKDELAKRMPKYVCFILKPEEANWQFVLKVHRMTRMLDDDPYTDTIWGIITGYDVYDALRIAACSDPLVIHKALSATFTFPMENFDEAIRYNESQKNYEEVKTKDGVIKETTCPDDTTKELVDNLNNYKPDLFITSGHASERDWRIGYNYDNGEFRCKDGVLRGVDLEGTIYPVNSPNPKVYIAPGNCRIANIKNRNSIALAYMSSCGANQMVGYTVRTIQGYGGWGTYLYFMYQPGRFTLAESWYLNNQSLINRLETRFPDKARVDIDNWDDYTDPTIMSILGYKHWDINVEENVKLINDRDTVVLYGDPAWDARLVSRNTGWEQKLTEKDGVYTFELTGLEDTTCMRPPAMFLPHRVRNVEILVGKELAPLVTDNFLMLPKLEKVEKGKIYRLVFKAEKAYSM
ncbi:MAG: hypothetical protein ABFD46_09360 [Armatimonadota bacterium]